MTIETLLKDYVAYNLWANTQMVEWLKTIPLDLTTREVPSSFPSLQGTLLHIWSAEDIWLTRLRGESPTRLIATDFKGGTAEVFDGLLRTSMEFRDFITAQNPAYFNSQTHYSNTKGITFGQSSAQIIQHCMQHSTYHRGQIVTIARNLGLTDPPKTDYIVYVRIQAIQ